MVPKAGPSIEHHRMSGAVTFSNGKGRWGATTLHFRGIQQGKEGLRGGKNYL